MKKDRRLIWMLYSWWWFTVFLSSSQCELCFSCILSTGRQLVGKKYLLCWWKLTNTFGFWYNLYLSIGNRIFYMRFNAALQHGEALKLHKNIQTEGKGQIPSTIFQCQEEVSWNRCFSWRGVITSWLRRPGPHFFFLISLSLSIAPSWRTIFISFLNRSPHFCRYPWWER